ncbi:MAG TPA: potassium channel family protein, partial [Longimicrobiaceae bacterium]|nr:potassium channel family protein [Longimicrobiaceae bacterium]
MSGATALYSLLGIGILALVLYDVFTTVLHHWGGAGLISGRLAHGVWDVAVGLTRGMESRRRRYLLGKVGPLLVPGTVVLWAGLLIVGFALLYLPWLPGSFHGGRAIPEVGSVGDAIYYSGVTFFTVGYGDIVPVQTGLRLIAMLEGGSGFALITLVVSYFTSIYTAYS